jgi:hypothetical protein
VGSTIPPQPEQEGAPRGAPLGSSGDPLTPPHLERQNRRSDRHRLKRAQRAITAARSSRLCWYAAAGQVVVDVGRQRTAHVSQVHRCGSAWACPVCAPVIRERRAQEVNQGLSTHLERGGGALFLTLTVQHHRPDRLADRLEAVAESLRSVLKGSGWERRRDRLGYVGSIKAVEVTWGEANGWHPHSHTALLFERPLEDAEVLDLHAWIWGRWSKVCADRGLGQVHPVHGVDLRPITDGDGIGGYVTKIADGWTAGHELTRGDRKSSSPLQLLRDFVQTGDTSSRDLWLEYEAATFGRNALRWSAGLRLLLLGEDDDQADADLAASEGIDLTLLRAIIDAEDWNRVTRAGATAELLTSIEHGAALLLLLFDLFGGNPQPLDAPRPEPPLEEDLEPGPRRRSPGARRST